jgi:hypothetical protein
MMKERQGVQNSFQARPQRVKTGDAPSGVRWDLNDARTQLGDFFNVLLIGVAYAASSYELQELGSGLRLTTEGAQHGAADRDGVLFFDPPHHHAKMPRFDDHAYSMSIELQFQGFSDLDSESLLDLQPARKDVHDAWNLAEPHHFLIRQVPDMDSAIKW